MTLNGDADDLADSLDNINIAAGMTVETATLLTLRADTAGIDLAGTTTFRGGNGITISDSMTGTSGMLVFDADYTSPGDGTFTLESGKTLTSGNSAVTITAWDVDLQGNMAFGSGSGTIIPAKVAQTIGLGDTSTHAHRRS
jgi:hypothetical protein